MEMLLILTPQNANIVVILHIGTIKCVCGKSIKPHRQTAENLPNDLLFQIDLHTHPHTSSAVVSCQCVFGFREKSC